MNPHRPDAGTEDHRSAAEMLEALAEANGGETIGLGEIAEATGGRATGLVLLALALPEMIPMIGFSALLAAPIFVIGAYMAWSGSETDVPGWVRRRSLKRSRVAGAVRKLLPLLRWLGRVSKPRWSRLAHSPRLHGVVCLLMAFVLAVPIPGVNILAAFGVGGTGIGMLQRDGAVIAVALACSALALAGVAAVVTGAVALLR